MKQFRGSGNGSAHVWVLPAFSGRGMPSSPATLDKTQASIDDVDSIADSGQLCRICFDDESSGPLISPCKCRGTQGLVHEECLLRWRRLQVIQGKLSAAMRCEICGSKYAAELRQPTRPFSAELADFCQELVDTTRSLSIYFATSQKLCCFVFVGLTCWHYGVRGILGLGAIFVSMVFVLHRNGMRLSVMGTLGQERRLGITSFGPPVDGLAPGMLLVSIGALGPFTKTVLYVIRHNDHGSLAVILNKIIVDSENRNKVGSFTMCGRSGGPVDSPYVPLVHFIHDREGVLGAQRILQSEEIFLNQATGDSEHDLGFIQAMAKDPRPGRLVVIKGVSSWRDRQLEGEVRRKAWGWIPPEHVQAQDILEMDPEKLGKLWERLLYSPNLRVFEG